MPLESATYIDGLVTTNPVASDAISTADDHLRLIKATIKATFPNITGPVTLTQAKLNDLLEKSGGTMTGNLTMGAGTVLAIQAPSADSHATTKLYVDTADNLRVLKTTTVTAGTGLTGGGDLSANRTISIASGGVGTAQLADGAVTSGKLAAGAVGSSQIAGGSITADKLANNSVTHAKLNVVGSVGDPPISAARAWVNFNGVGTVNIRAGNNVSSVTDNGVGDYTINFTYAMAEANYAVFVSSDGTRTNSQLKGGGSVYTTSSVQIITTDTSTTNGTDRDFIYVAIFR